jgi:hypothetical protein
MGFSQTMSVGNRKVTISDTIEVPDYLILSSRGPKRTGKSHLGGTMPGSIGWLPFDPNSRWTAEKLQREGAKIIMPTTEFNRVEDPEAVAMMEPAAAKQYYWDYLKVVRAVYNRYLDTPQIKSIVIDTGGQLFEDVMYAHYGRKTTAEIVAYGAPRQTFKDWFITPCSKNLLICHHARPVYVDNKKTGAYEIEGCSKLPDWVSAEVEHFFMESQADAQIKKTLWGGMHDDNRDAAKWKAKQFGLRIINATMNMEAVGKCLIGDECNFEFLMYAISEELHAKYYG